MSPSTATNAATRREWRDLGFYYELRDSTLEWVLVGSRSAFLAFADELHRYARDPRNRTDGEHEHYGPYMYLKVMTWPEPAVDASCIRGTTEDIARLGDIIATTVDRMSEGQVGIGRLFAPDSPFDIVLQVKPEGFDPSTADPALSG